MEPPVLLEAVRDKVARDAEGARGRSPVGAADRARAPGSGDNSAAVSSGSITPPVVDGVPDQVAVAVGQLARSGSRDSFPGVTASDSPGEKHITPRDTAHVPVWRIVLTGGPCGGKTTALSTIAERLRNLSLQVFTVPENATLFSNAGAGFPVHSHKAHQLCWETSRMICQMEMEESFIRIARSSRRPTAIICDRGVMDARAYMDDPTWRMLLEKMGWAEPKLRDERYDMVLHLVTTAIGAPQYYCKTVYRHENAEEAAALDDKIRGVWGEHRNRVQIDNSTGYDAKVQRVVTAICRFLGVPAPGGSTARVSYRLAPTLPSELPCRHEEFRTLLLFLQKSTAEEYQCLRMRQHGDGATFVFGHKTQEMYTECPTTEKEFEAMLELAHQRCAPLDMLKKVWAEGGMFFEASAGADFSLLTVEVDCLEGKKPAVELPAWIAPHVVREVTHDPAWQLFSIAQRIWKQHAAAAQPGAPPAEAAAHCAAGAERPPAAAERMPSAGGTQ